MLFKRRNSQLIAKLHGDIVAASRQPEFYRDHGVRDTLDGRFELLALHAILVLRRLQQLPAPAPAHAKALADAVFGGLDHALREMGVGDTVLPKRMGRMLEAFSGRMLAYGRALEAGGEGLAQALARNVLDGQGDGLWLAGYVVRAAEALAGMDLPAFESRGIVFPEIAAIPARNSP